MITKSDNYYSDREAVKEHSKSSMSGVVELPDFSGNSSIFGKDFGPEIAQMEHLLISISSFPREYRITSVCVLLASFILNSTHLNNKFSLTPLDTQIGNQNLSDFNGLCTPDSPFKERASAFAHRWMSGNLTAENFLSEIDGLCVDLANDNKFKEDRSITIARRMIIYANSDTTIGVNT